MLTSVGPYYATALSYHPNGMIKQVTHAKRVFDVAAGFAEKGDRDANAMARPATIYTTGVTLPGTGVVANWNTGSYAFDGVGNIKTEGSDTFVYDKVSRLVSAKITNVTEAYAFDAFGNMTSYAGRALELDPATNRLTTGASYDAAGSLTSWKVSTDIYRATWDKLNQQIGHTGLGINRLLAYTAAGERILVRDRLANQATITLRDLAGHVVREVSVTTTVNNGPLQRNINLRATRDLLLPRLISGELDITSMEVGSPT